MLVRVESHAGEMDAAPIHRPPCCCSCKAPPAAPPPSPRPHAGVVLWRVACAEAAGTALLVALAGLQGAAGGVAGALAAGLAVAALVQCFVRASGAQLNPAVTAAALVAGRMGCARAGVELAAQAAGATLAAAALRATLGAGAGVVAGAAGAGATLALEAGAGAVLALANSAEWDPRAAPAADSWPLRIGATVAALTLATERSGASMNPARHFGPALVNGAWRLCWAYWVGPVAGAALAAAAYRLVWRPPPPSSPDRPDCS